MKKLDRIMKKIDRIVLSLALAAAVVASIALCTPAAFAQNKGGTLLPSAARTAASIQSADIVNIAGKYLNVVTVVSAYTSGNITVTIQGKDPASGTYYTVLACGAISSATTQVCVVGPALTAATNIANAAVPTTWRVSVAGASTPVSTYSIGFTVVQ